MSSPTYKHNINTGAGVKTLHKTWNLLVNNIFSGDTYKTMR